MCFKEKNFFLSVKRKEKANKDDNFRGKSQHERSFLRPSTLNVWEGSWLKSELASKSNACAFGMGDRVESPFWSERRRGARENRKSRQIRESSSQLWRDHSADWGENILATE